MSVDQETINTLWKEVGKNLAELVAKWHECHDSLQTFKPTLTKYYDETVSSLVLPDVNSLLKKLKTFLTVAGFDKLQSFKYLLPSFLKDVGTDAFPDNDVGFLDVAALATALQEIYSNSLIHISTVAKFWTFYENDWIPPLKKLKNGIDVWPALQAESKPHQDARLKLETEAKAVMSNAFTAASSLSMRQVTVFDTMMDTANRLAALVPDPAVQSWAVQARALRNATKAWACAYNACKCQNQELRLPNLALACRLKLRSSHCNGNICTTLSGADYNVICDAVIKQAAEQWSNKPVTATGLAASKQITVSVDTRPFEKVHAALYELSKQSTGTTDTASNLGGGAARLYKTVLPRRSLTTGASMKAHPTHRNTAGQGLGRKRPATTPQSAAGRKSAAGRQNAAGRKSAAGRQNAAGRKSAAGQSLAASRKSALGRRRAVGTHGGQRLQGGHHTGERTSGQKRTAGRRASTQARIQGASAAGTQNVNLRRVPARSARLLSTLARGPQGSGSGQAKTAAARARQVGRRGISAKGGNAKGNSAKGISAKGISARGISAKGGRGKM